MTVYLNNTLIASPNMDGTKLTRPKTWATGAGRSASGTMTGRVQYFKYSLVLSWSWLTAAQFRTIKNICEGSDYLSVKVIDSNTGTVNFTAYAGDVDYSKESYAGSELYVGGVTVTLVER